MKKTMLVAAALALIFVAGASRRGAAAKPEAITLSPSEMKFGPPPPVLPAGAQLAVLHGDPGKKGPFAMRLKMPDGYKIAPHWHTNDEELTIVSGMFFLSMGDKQGENMHALEPGSYHYLPGKMHHAASTKGETVVEIHGTGPFDLHYLDPADDPSKAATKK
jgi:hypothetical protein